MSVDIIVPNQTRYLRLVGNIAELVAREIETGDANDRDMLAYHLNVVLTEAVANAIEYADRTNSTQTVKICLSLENNSLLIRVHDQGQGFDFASLPTPEPADLLNERGRGIFLIRTLMDSVEYHKCGAGNVLEMRKFLKSP